jgi:hypothetical protein
MLVTLEKKIIDTQIQKYDEKKKMKTPKFFFDILYLMKTIP